jgi:hypothetical protein
MLAAGAAPVIVRAASLMPGRGLIVSPTPIIWEMANKSAFIFCSPVVRELMMYEIRTNSMLVRHDIAFDGEQYHVDNCVAAGPEGIARARKLSGRMLVDRLQESGKTWADCLPLPLPAGMGAQYIDLSLDA